jgi:hypothetical protein
LSCVISFDFDWPPDAAQGSMSLLLRVTGELPGNRTTRRTDLFRGLPCLAVNPEIILPLKKLRIS